MTIDGNQGLRPHEVQPLDRAGNASAGAPGGTTGPQGVAFQRLLERLSSLKQGEGSGESGEVDPETAESESARKLRDALAQADKDYSAAMDLRRQLEDAFRRHQP